MRSTFYYAGILLGFAVSGKSMLRVEVLYERNVQQVIRTTAGVHFFL